MTPIRRRPSRGFAILLSLFLLSGLVVAINAASAATVYVGSAISPAGGYWLATSEGKVTNVGGAAHYGDMSGHSLNKPAVAMASTSTGHGYWLVASDGGIFSFGDASFYGSTGSIKLNKPVVGMAATPTGHGYWLVASDGGIFAYGDASFFGSTGSMRLNEAITAMAATPSGNGYWLVASDGGIFAFGDAAFYGSTGNIKLNKSVVGMTALPNGKGYWLVASDGGVFAFGAAPFLGSGVDHGGSALVIVGDGNGGYAIVMNDGGVVNCAVPGSPANTTTSTTSTTSTPNSTTTTTTVVGSNTNVLGLDESGATIPDTNYSIPAGAIFMSTAGVDTNLGTQSSPVLTLNKALTLVPTGGTVVMRNGLYRDWYSSSGGTTWGVLTKAVTIQAYPHEQPWLDGTDAVSSGLWTSDGSGHWYISQSTPMFCGGHYYDLPLTSQSTSPNTGPCAHYDMSQDPSNPMAVDPQMVWVNGANQTEASALSGVNATTFYYDWSAKRIYVGVNPASATIEVAKRPIALTISADNYKILGIGFKRFATNEYSNITAGAFYGSGKSGLIENDVFKQNAGQAVAVQPINTIVRHSVFVDNGFNGMGSNGHQHSTGEPDNLTIENNVFNHNNTEKFGYGCTVSCAQANIKIAHMDGYTLRNNILENATGQKAAGFWCDLACSGGVMINNTARNNTGDGIFYEVSDGGIVASNLSVNNGYYGIRVGSANTKIYNNTIVNNLYGLWIYDDSRSPGVGGWTDVGPDTRNVAMANNVVTGAAFMTYVSARTGSSAPNTTADQFFSLADYNSYYQASGPTSGYFRWVADFSGTGVNYKTQSSFVSATGLEQHSLLATTPAPFADVGGSDYSITAGSGSYHNGTAIPADVMSVLGLTFGTGLSRGAIKWATN